jgi:hypothetical protein
MRERLTFFLSGAMIGITFVELVEAITRVVS